MQWRIGAFPYIKNEYIFPLVTEFYKQEFENRVKFQNNAQRFASKATPILTHKKIAEKFRISEDFTLVK